METFEVKFKKMKGYKNIYNFFIGEHEIGCIKLSRKDFDYTYFYGNVKENMDNSAVGLKIEELVAITKEIKNFVRRQRFRKWGIEE